MPKIIKANQKFLEEQVRQVLSESIGDVINLFFPDYEAQTAMALQGTIKNILEDIETLYARMDMEDNPDYDKISRNREIITKIKKTFPLNTRNLTHYEKMFVNFISVNMPGRDEAGQSQIQLNLSKELEDLIAYHRIVFKDVAEGGDFSKMGRLPPAVSKYIKRIKQTSLNKFLRVDAYAQSISMINFADRTGRPMDVEKLLFIPFKKVTAPPGRFIKEQENDI
ncbi:MAG TPA: hypothetical protein DCM40_25290, partial [Maribacter sp.]|nr:hypothetical protein [Maribacter sp.]